MKFIFFLFIPLICISQNTFEKTWATYYNDGNCTLGSSTMDKDGNVYMVGQVKQQSVFTPSNNAFQSNFGGGNSDGFITKFSPNGEVVWATFFGGSADDILESITIDDFNNIYVIGLTNSSNNIATSNSFRATLTNSTNSFFAKFDENGYLIWSTYFTDNSNGNSIGIGENILLSSTGISYFDNNIYAFSKINEDNQATQNTFQSNRDTAQFLISKFDLNGNRIWSSYYGINESYVSGLTVNQSGIYICGRSSSCNSELTNYFATSNAFQTESYGECGTPFLSKFSLNGQREWSTYFGGNLLQDDIIYKNSIKCFNDNIYFTGSTGREDLATVDSFQQTKDDYFGNYLAKFNSNGQRVWVTYLGLNRIDNYYAEQRSLQIDFNGNIYIAGVTNLQNNISTNNTFQNSLSPFLSSLDFRTDAYAVKFNENGQKIWGTYFGSTNDEYYSEILPFGNSFYMFGITRSLTNISTPNSYQENFNFNGVVDSEDSNIFLARFDPTNLSNEDFVSSSIKIYPNPATNELFIKNENNIELSSITVNDVTGKKVITQDSFFYSINISNLSKGMYFVTIETKTGNTVTSKIIKE